MRTNFKSIILASVSSFGLAFTSVADAQTVSQKIELGDKKPLLKNLLKRAKPGVSKTGKKIFTLSNGATISATGENGVQGKAHRDGSVAFGDGLVVRPLANGVAGIYQKGNLVRRVSPQKARVGSVGNATDNVGPANYYRNDGAVDVAAIGASIGNGAGASGLIKGPTFKPGSLGGSTETKPSVGPAAGPSDVSGQQNGGSIFTDSSAGPGVGAPPVQSRQQEAILTEDKDGVPIFKLPNGTIIPAKGSDGVIGKPNELGGVDFGDGVRTVPRQGGGVITLITPPPGTTSEHDGSAYPPKDDPTSSGESIFTDSSAGPGVGAPPVQSRQQEAILTEDKDGVPIFKLPNGTIIPAKGSDGVIGKPNELGGVDFGDGVRTVPRQGGGVITLRTPPPGTTVEHNSEKYEEKEDTTSENNDGGGSDANSSNDDDEQSSSDDDGNDDSSSDDSDTDSGDTGDGGDSGDGGDDGGDAGEEGDSTTEYSPGVNGRGSNAVTKPVDDFVARQTGMVGTPEDNGPKECEPGGDNGPRPNAEPVPGDDQACVPAGALGKGEEEGDEAPRISDTLPTTADITDDSFGRVSQPGIDDAIREDISPTLESGLEDLEGAINPGDLNR